MKKVKKCFNCGTTENLITVFEISRTEKRHCCNNQICMDKSNLELLPLLS